MFLKYDKNRSLPGIQAVTSLFWWAVEGVDSCPGPNRGIAD